MSAIDNRNKTAARQSATMVEFLCQIDTPPIFFLKQLVNVLRSILRHHVEWARRVNPVENVFMPTLLGDNVEIGL